jgi:hypothetical protein
VLHHLLPLPRYQQDGPIMQTATVPLRHVPYETVLAYDKLLILWMPVESLPPELDLATFVIRALSAFFLSLLYV